MKKLLKWIFPAILGIVPALGAEGLPFDVINDPFLTSKTTTCSIDNFIENEGKFYAAVTGISHTEFNAQHEPMSKTAYFKAACKVLDLKHDDAKFTTYETILLQVALSGTPQPLTKQFRRELPYTLVGEEEEKRYLKGIALGAEESLPVGIPVQVCKVLKYKRAGELPEAQPLEIQGPKLYELLREQATNPLGEVAVCLRCGYPDGSFKGNRHDIQVYYLAEVKDTTSKLVEDVKTIISEVSKKTLTANAGGNLTKRPNHDISNDTRTAAVIGTRDQVLQLGYEFK